MRIIGLRESVVGKIILIILISFSNLLWAFLSTIGGLFFFMAVKGDKRVTAGVKIALYGTEFSREFSAVSICWEA